MMKQLKLLDCMATAIDGNGKIYYCQARHPHSYHVVVVNNKLCYWQNNNRRPDYIVMSNKDE